MNDMSWAEKVGVYVFVSLLLIIVLFVVAVIGVLAVDFIQTEIQTIKENHREAKSAKELRAFNKKLAKIAKFKGRQS